MYVFAKRYTTEKVIILCQNNKIGEKMEALNRQFGGNWIYVDSINKETEILKIDDNLKYEGFKLSQERYINGVETLN